VKLKTEILSYKGGCFLVFRIIFTLPEWKRYNGQSQLWTPKNTGIGVQSWLCDYGKSAYFQSFA
jgi:hypothetical protein